MDEVEVTLYVGVECPKCKLVMRIETDSLGKYYTCFCHSQKYELPKTTIKPRY